MVGLAGRILDRYTLGQRIGKGGMADVYLAYDPHFQRAVAIKIFKQDDDGMLQRFMREAKLMASLYHPHLMPIYDTGESEVDGITRYYIVMPFIDGGTLGIRIHRSPLSSEEVSKYLFYIASALDCLHSHGIIHRDIKSTNVLLSSDDLCYLSDLGVARVLDDSNTLTSTGNVLGTVDYIAPELFVGFNKADARSDIYSLGVLLFEMVIGQRPFSAENQVAIASMHVNDPPPLPHTLLPTISPHVERVLLEALEKEPERRFPTATALANAFSDATKMRYSPVPAIYGKSAVPILEPAVAVSAPNAQPIDQRETQASPSIVEQPVIMQSVETHGEQETLLVPSIHARKNKRARIITFVLVTLLFTIAVPFAWILGQMHAVNNQHMHIILPNLSTITVPAATVRSSPTSGSSLTPQPSPVASLSPSSSTPSAPGGGVASLSPSGNLIQDPSYEMQNSGQLEPPWTGVGDVSIDFNAGQAYAGKNDARLITDVDNSWVEVGQNVNVTPNTTYTLSVYIHTSNRLTINSTVFGLRALKGPVIKEVHYGPSPANYSQMTITFQSGSADQVYVHIGFVGKAHMWLLADNWALYPSKT